MQITPEEYYLYKEDVIALLQYAELHKSFWATVPEEIRNEYRKRFVNPAKIDRICATAEELIKKIKNPKNIRLMY